MSRRRRQSRRTVAVVAIVVVALLGAGLVARSVRDARQTYSTADVLAALHAFRPPGAVDVSSAGSTDDGRNPDTSCNRLALTPAGVLDTATWAPSSPRPDNGEVLVAHYPDPAAARRAMNAFVSALRDCRGARIGESWTVADVPGLWRSRLLHRPVVWKLVAVPGQPTVDVAVVVAVHGNLLMRYSASGADTSDEQMRSAPRDLVAALQATR